MSLAGSSLLCLLQCLLIQLKKRRVLHSTFNGVHVAPRMYIDHVKELKTVSDLTTNMRNLADIDYSIVADEFNSLVRSLNTVGAKVFLADDKYFPVGHRGVYHTVGNNFFLNVAHMGRPGTLMSVMRHEGWHAAQDCMAGTIDNNFIAIIKPEEEVPGMYEAIVKSAYISSTIGNPLGSRSILGRSY
ncbi:MAG: hypothetical protein CM15mV24_0880 [Bellamyvirus sp.]|nr:MAG: hypothetical protein CM15mV24_0880 [Bellamyvirus sp.]